VVRRRRHASLALAALVVVARLVGSGGTATASTSAEESIRADLSHHRTPSRTLRSQHGAHARVVARDATLDACLASMPFVVEDPPRTLARPTLLPLAAPVAALPPPAAQARAPPR
jgi:hypothetical protein